MTQETGPVNIHLSNETQEEIDRKEGLAIIDSWKELFSSLEAAVLIEGAPVRDLTLSGPLETKAHKFDAQLTIRPYYCFGEQPGTLVLDIHEGEDAGDGQWLGSCLADAIWENNKPKIIRYDEDLFDIDGKYIDIKDVIDCATNIVKMSVSVTMENGLDVDGVVYPLQYPSDFNRPEPIH